MMWPFKKTIKLTAITAKPDLVRIFPLVAAKDAMPSWYKSTPLTYEHGVCPVQRSITNLSGTIKSCPGVTTLLRKGFILPAWEDISIIVYPDGTFSSVGAFTNPPAGVHSKEQMPLSMQHYTIIKLKSPWAFYGDDTEYLFTPVPYHDALSRKYYVPSGIVNYKYQHSTNVFLAAEPKDKPYEIVIRAGQPLMQIIPLTNKKIHMDCKYDPSHAIAPPRHFFLLHGYQRYVKWIKRNGNAR